MKSMKKYTGYELETIINFNDGEITANILTRSPYLIRHIEKLAKQFPGEVSITFAPNDYREYTVPQKWIRVSHPPRYSEEERQRRRNRMIATLEKRRRRSANQHNDDCVDCPPPHTDADCPTGPYEGVYCPYDNLEP